MIASTLRSVCLRAEETGVSRLVLGNHANVYALGLLYSAPSVISNATYEQYVVEDAKGARTAEYRIKRAMMLAIHGIRILET